MCIVQVYCEGCSESWMRFYPSKLCRSLKDIKELKKMAAESDMHAHQQDFPLEYTILFCGKPDEFLEGSHQTMTRIHTLANVEKMLHC